MITTRTIKRICRQGLSTVVAVFLLCNTIMFGFMHIPLAKANGASLATILDGNERVPIVICTGTGLKTIIARADGTPDTGQSDPPKGYHCTLCGLGNYTFALPISAELPERHALIFANAATALHVTATLHEFCDLVASPRGPPHTSIDGLLRI
ncbi:hypothetical protein LPB41_20085 [Thalassospira sp. MA62]|nr:hypothetical protein [Thalassospira sp. MA62]